ncbi:hypothetical protein SERLA73DRAFT_138575, partial [Serpula lacrymans var. lacrymans S7.3]
MTVCDHCKYANIVIEKEEEEHETRLNISSRYLGEIKKKISRNITAVSTRE